jgi:CheY-like chemotaxis protein
VAVARAADDVDAEVLLVAGDPQARRLLIDHLPARWAPLASEIEHSSTDAVEAATVQAIQAVAEDRRASALDDYHLRGVTGLGAVAEAARRGQIRTLLLPEQGVDGQLWMDPGSTELGLRRDDLVATRDGARNVAACDALMRAAALTDADVMLAGDGQLPDGAVGAVLRWTDNARPPASRFTDWAGGS